MDPLHASGDPVAGSGCGVFTHIPTAVMHPMASGVAMVLTSCAPTTARKGLENTWKCLGGAHSPPLGICMCHTIAKYTARQEMPLLVSHFTDLEAEV